MYISVSDLRIIEGALMLWLLLLYIQISGGCTHRCSICILYNMLPVINSYHSPVRLDSWCSQSAEWHQQTSAHHAFCNLSFLVAG
jgi:hypothetical protein